MGEVEYLGQLMSGNGVKANPKKLEAMVNWPKPTTVKALRGFFWTYRLLQKTHQGLWENSWPTNSITKKGRFLLG